MRTELFDEIERDLRSENHAKNGTLTEQQAKKIIGEILERTTGEPLRNYKVRDWLDHWLDMKEQVRAGKPMEAIAKVIGAAPFCLVTTLAHGLATWQTCDGTRLMGAVRPFDSRRAKRKNQ
jgi:hypothetical protein